MQYICAIMRYGIRCNIINIANQLFFAYQGLAPKLQVFVSPPTKSTKAANFIHTLKKKQKIWHEWWPLWPDSNSITNRHKDSHLTSSLYQVNLKLFLITNLSITYPSHHSLGNSLPDPLSKVLTSGNPPHLLDLNAITLVNFFVNHLCCNANTTLMCNSVVGCCLYQTPCHEPPQITNQLITVYARWVTQPITTYHANPVAPRKSRYANILIKSTLLRLSENWQKKSISGWQKLDKRSTRGLLHYI